MTNQLPTPFVIREATERLISPRQLGDLFARSGICRPADDLPRLAKMIAHANLLAGAWLEDRLVGVVRGLTDFSYCCYLSDLAVDREYQRIGIGKPLIKHIHARVSDEATIILLCASEAKDYYKPLGFEWVDNAVANSAPKVTDVRRGFRIWPPGLEWRSSD